MFGKTLLYEFYNSYSHSGKFIFSLGEIVLALAKTLPIKKTNLTISEERVRSRPRLGWMDGVKVALGSRGMTL